MVSFDGEEVHTLVAYRLVHEVPPHPRGALVVHVSRMDNQFRAVVLCRTENITRAGVKGAGLAGEVEAVDPVQLVVTLLVALPVCPHAWVVVADTGVGDECDAKRGGASVGEDRRGEDRDYAQ